jgi:CTP:molybdopterin cytidylyltransferase MocA
VSVTSVVIAADRGDGFAVPKQLAPFGGGTVLGSVVEAVATWPTDDSLLVLGADAERILEEIEVPDWTIIIDPEWKEGIGASIRVALDVVSRGKGADLVVLARGDQPGVTPAIVEGLLAERRASGASIVLPKYRYAFGWPILVHEDTWQWLMGLEGDVDLAELLHGRPSGVSEAWFDHLGPRLITSPDDLPGGAV